MLSRTRMTVFIVLAFTLLISAVVVTAEPTEAQSARDTVPELKSDYLTPHHAALSTMAGDYSLQSRLWVSPESEPIVTQLTAHRSMSLIDHVLELTVTGSSESNYPFQGRGFTGFDTSLDQHWYVWMDTTSTGVALLFGTLAEDGTGTLTGNITGRRRGIATSLRIEVRREGSAEIHDYYSPGDDGEEWKWLELAYWRS